MGDFTTSCSVPAAALSSSAATVASGHSMINASVDPCRGTSTLRVDAVDSSSASRTDFLAAAQSWLPFSAYWRFLRAPAAAHSDNVAGRRGYSCTRHNGLSETKSRRRV